MNKDEEIVGKKAKITTNFISGFTVGDEIVITGVFSSGIYKFKGVKTFEKGVSTINHFKIIENE